MARTEQPEAALRVAALPYRLGRHGLEILLLSRRGWVIPSGTTDDEIRHPDRSAEIEAFRQAGVRGSIARRSIGSYGAGAEDGETDVYPLLVSNEAATWPDKTLGRRVWFPGPEAAATVSDAGLAALIREWLEERVNSGRGVTKQARGRGGSRHG